MNNFAKRMLRLACPEAESISSADQKIRATRKRGDTNKRVTNAKLHQLGWTPDYPTFRDAMKKSILASLLMSFRDVSC